MQRLTQQRLTRAYAPSAIIPAVLDLRRDKPKDKPLIVGIGGASASGKGELLKALATQFSENKETGGAAILALDNYYCGRKEMAKRGVPHFDHPAALDLERAAADIAKMRVGKRIQIPSYDFPTGERIGMEDFAVKPIVFVDGLYALSPILRAQIDYAIFIETDVDSAMLRRLFRDAGPRGRTKQSSSAVLAQFFREVVPSMHTHIMPTAESANLVIESRFDPPTEAARAGLLKCQCKAVGYVSDEDIFDRVRGQRIGSTFRQDDLLLKPKGRTSEDEMLRLRTENGSLFLTYMGPHIASVQGVEVRHVTQPIELDPGADAWFQDDYAVVAELSKLRTLFAAGDLIIARDSIRPLGSFIEVRAANEASAPKTRETLERLQLNRPYYTESYFAIHARRKRAADAAAPGN